jgi:hypothetical protein
MWETTTPDGMSLTIRYEGDGWLATYLQRRVGASTAEEAIRGALGVGSPADDATLEKWIAEHVSALEAEQEQDQA